MTDTIPARSEAVKEHTWDAESIFATVEDWEAALAKLDGELPGLIGFQGTLGGSPDAVLAWIDTYYTLLHRAAAIHQYAMMFSVVDTGDQEAAARTARARGLWSRFQAATAFAGPEMLAIEPSKLKKWMLADTRLAIYAHYFKELEDDRRHTRSVEVETLLGQVGDAFSGPRQAHSLLSDSEIRFSPAVDSTGAEHEIGQPTIHGLLGHADRDLRRSAWENYADGYLGFKKAFAACLTGGVKQNVFMARAKRFESAKEQWLHGFHFPVEAFHNVIEACRSQAHVWHRYFDVLRRALGYEKLHVYDIKAPLVKTSPEVTYRQAIDWICAGMEPLGARYVTAMRRGLLEERWVDVYPNRGKNMGAFSSGHQGSRPFIFMSDNNDLFGMSTLAHELGHSMHSWLAWQKQPPVYAGCGSEVPSNFNQAMTRAYLLKTIDDRDFQLALIEEALSNFHRYFLVMPALAQFELEIHSRVERGEALTADGMIELMTSLFQHPFGDAVTIDAERLGITWAQFPTHIYGNIFMFLYTVGIAGAHALSEPILAGQAGAAERYLDYLEAGASRYELDGLKHAGVDLSTPEPVIRTFGVLNQLVDRLEALTC